jgi:hypothetical protein
MSDALATYLHDHLAGSRFAIELLESLHDRYKEQELGSFALALCGEIKQDQETLKQIIEKVGTAHLDLMEAAGWIGEKASKLKLQRDGSGGGIGTFEALEALALGIHGKLELWRVMPVVAQIDARVPEKDFGALAERAEQQHGRVETHRLQLAKTTFATRT